LKNNCQIRTTRCGAQQLALASVLVINTGQRPVILAQAFNYSPDEFDSAEFFQILLLF
jgi:hypothetical protein